MRHLDRIIEGLRTGDRTTIMVLVFAFIGAAAIFAITGVIRKRRQQRAR